MKAADSSASLRAQVLDLFGRLAALHDADGSAPLSVWFARGNVEVRYCFTAADLAPYLPTDTNPLDQLSRDDQLVLKKLVTLAEAATGKELATSLRVPHDSAFRARLAPASPLRTLGLVEHVEGEGYAATALGRAAVKRA